MQALAYLGVRASSRLVSLRQNWHWGLFNGDRYGILLAGFMMANGTKIESRRRWISALAVTVSAVVAYMAFWHIWPVATFLVGVTASLALIVSAVAYYRSG